MLLWDDQVFRYRLRGFLKEQDRISKLYQPDLDRARKANDREQEHSVYFNMAHELDLVADQITQLQQRYLSKQARILLIPLPEFKQKDGDWRELHLIGGYALTGEALLRLARDVRQERRERLELVFLWPSALIGLVGGLVGIATAIFG